MSFSKLRIIVIAMFLTLISGCGGGGSNDAATKTPPGTSATATLTKITITPATGMVTLGDSVAFTAIATYSDSTTEDITNKSSWATSDTSVATLDSSGHAFTQAHGSSEIDASYKGVHSDKSPLLVINNATLLGSFVATGAMMTARQEHTGTLLANGQVLVCGGHSSLTNLSSAELYNPTTGLFTATGNMASARYAHTATLLGNKKVLITGGYNGAATAGAELYDPVTGQFTATGNLNTARLYQTATLLHNGKVLIVGGSSSAGLSSAELYDPATGQFTNTGSMSAPRRMHTATLLKNGKVLVAGGQDGVNFSASAEVYDPATGLFTAANPMSVGRVQHVAALLPDGKVLVTGGFGGTSVSAIYHASAELYDPTTNDFTPTANNMSAVRWLHANSTLNLINGKILITGGRNGGIGSTILTNADVYNPATGLFSATGNLLVPRQYHSATILLNGKVLVAGGMDITGTAAISSAELYQ